jgi:hypothetical protein
MPVARDGLRALGCFRAALGHIVRPAHGEVAGEQEDLFPVVAQPGPERVAGVVPLVPVPQPVVDDPGGDGGVVAFAQVIEDLLVQAGVPAGGLDSFGEQRVPVNRGAPVRSVMSSYRSSARAAVSSRIAKSRTRTAGRVSSASHLSQVRSAFPPARLARTRLVFMNRASAPARIARWARAWAMWLLPAPTVIHGTPTRSQQCLRR